MSHLLRTSRLFAWLFLTGLSVAIIVTSGFYLYLRPGLPPVEQLLDIKLQTPLRIYSQDSRLIAEFGEKRRAPITIEQIPTIQLQAFLAAEDSRFYEHAGVDIKGLARAAIELVSTGSIQSGGSTITMQVAKNYFLSRDRTFIRKFNEILLALQIERELDKNRILELYLNKIYLAIELTESLQRHRFTTTSRSKNSLLPKWPCLPACRRHLRRLTPWPTRIVPRSGETGSLDACGTWATSLQMRMTSPSLLH